MKQFVQMIKISKICTCTMNDVNLMLLSIKLNVKFDVWEEAISQHCQYMLPEDEPHQNE